MFGVVSEVAADTCPRWASCGHASCPLYHVSNFVPPYHTTDRELGEAKVDHDLCQLAAYGMIYEMKGESEWWTDSWAVKPLRA